MQGQMSLLEREAQLRREDMWRWADQRRLAHQAAPGPQWTFRLAAVVSQAAARLKTWLASWRETQKVRVPYPQAD